LWTSQLLPTCDDIDAEFGLVVERDRHPMIAGKSAGVVEFSFDSALRIPHLKVSRL
jgi:hypothetical protein